MRGSSRAARRALIALLNLVVIATVAHAQDLTVLRSGAEGISPGEMVDAYLKQLAYAAFERRKAEYEKLKTAEQLTAHQKRMREFFVESIGGFPRRTPLNAKIVGKMSRRDYRIEKVIFESQPRHYVTGVMYLPRGKPPYAGVLVPCGHSANGKASELYQRACILLAKNGLAAFCYDPIGQGERYQILDAEGKPKYGSTAEHTLVGVGCILLGANTARYRIYDGMRAIDYMLSRGDIDPKRIGCTGNSGGGTLTSYLMALDQRILCAAPSCYLTSLHRLMDTRGPQDAEQNIHGQIAFGMDHADYVMMRAPKPTLMCVATRDYFDIGGAWDTFRQAKRFYTRMGFAERVDLIETDEKHGFSTQLRVGMVRWMRRWLLGIDDAITEPDVPVATDEELQCTPQGQVMLMEGARSVFDLNADMEKRLARERRKFWKDTPKAEALQKVREIAGVRRLADVPECEHEQVGVIEREGYRIEKVVLRPEDGVPLPALAFVPSRVAGTDSQDTSSGVSPRNSAETADAYLYVHGEGKDVDAGAGGPIEKLVRQGHLVLAVDLRGIGETGNATGSRKHSELFGPERSNYFLAYFLSKSYVGMRAEDVLAAARFLSGYRKRVNPYKVHLVGIGEAGPAALHAAALEPRRLASLTLRRSLVSWSNLIRTPEARSQLVNTVHGALRTYDLPDLVASLPEAKLTVEEPLDAAGEPVGSET